MPRNPFWMIFISLIICGVLGYTTYTVAKVWQYTRLNENTPTKSIQWSVVSQGEASFTPFATYSFSKDNKSYRGQTRWKESYLNEWTAQEAVTRLKKNPPAVWLNSADPENSSLQKLFPIKETLYSALLWILGIYFLCLGYYVNRRFL